MQYNPSGLQYHMEYIEFKLFEIRNCHKNVYCVYTYIPIIKHTICELFKLFLIG